MEKMVDIEKYIDKSFINPYLNSVAFEIRFPASVRVIQDFANFHDLINERYPNFGEEVPFFDFSDKEKAPENLKKYVFSDNGQKSKVRLSINTLAIIITDYEQFSDFKEQVDHIIKSFYDSYGIKNSLRMGLRYINIFPLYNDLNQSLIESKELFISFLNTDIIPTDQIFSNNIEVRKNLPDNNKITLRSKFNYNKSKEKFQHVLDFDVYTSNVNSLQNYQKSFADLRIYEKTEFLKFVSEKFMAKMNFMD